MFLQVKTRPEIHAVSGLARTIWNEHYLPIIGKGQIDYMLEKFQSEEAISRQINDEGYAYFLIHDNDIHIGYTAFLPVKDELFLSKFYILSPFRSKGYGRKTIDFIDKKAGELNLRKIRLTVNKNNTGTIEAYKKIGFIITDLAVTDIGNGYIMDDFVMERDVKQETGVSVIGNR